MSKILHDFKQLQTPIAHISGTDGDIDRRKTALSTTTTTAFGKTFGELWSTNNRDYAAKL